MSPELAFPLRFYINLGPREDRRRECLLECEHQRLTVERMPSVNGRYVTSARGMGDRNRYACGLSQRLCLREAMRRKAGAVLLLEDDVVFHPEMRKRLARLTLPDDWGMFYLGCLHTSRPEVVAPGLVRITRANDLHAVAIRGTYYREVLRILKPRGRGAPVASVVNSDIALAEAHGRIPAYAAWPNLAWQRHSFSNNVGGAVSNYGQDDGRQLCCADTTEHLAEAMRTYRQRPPCR
jgi:hypothetical protein